MSKKPDPQRNKKGTGKNQEVSPEARRKQIIVGAVMGAIMGVVLSVLTTFWLWLPAGVAFGFAVGAIMKPRLRIPSANASVAALAA
ncbi:HPP family protein [Leucobacter insecticola]|uniref:HPP family protein n=1 Tax=Leucobacter insecticola TaxID=2714934 RepID=A0A6G8FFN6_9MICO|nr:HPP family protein [Leucobacter insecticola]QIM15220.1 HPP family protein [Leucobacter insecticola]